ncbi:MAG: hypothetical protein V4525_09315 [Pseudomonadota bacterium]
MQGILPLEQQSQPKKLFIIGCLLSIVPIWLVDYLPMIDLPEHAAQIATLKRLLLNKEYYSAYYDIVPLTPYWFAYLLTVIFSFFMPLTMALKCVISLAVALTSWSAASLRNLVSQDDSLDWIFLPIGYGFAFQWGFLTFMLSIPIAFLAFKYFLNYLFEPTPKKKIYCAILALILFFAHSITYIVIIFIVIMIEILTTKNFIKSIKLLFPLFSPLLIIIKWFFYLTDTWSYEIFFWGARNGINYEDFFALIGAYYSKILGIIFTLVIFVFPLCLRAKYIFGWQITPFIITSLLVLMGPTIVLDTRFFSERLSVLLIPFFVFFIHFDESDNKFSYKIRHLVSFFIAITLLIITGHKIYSFKKETLLIHRIIDKLEPNKKLYKFIDCTPDIAFHPCTFIHIGGWYRAEKDGISDDSFARYPSLVVTYKKRNLRQLDWKADLSYENYQKGKYLNYYDYYLFNGNHNKVNTIIKNNSIKANLIYKENDWWIFRRI